MSSLRDTPRLKAAIQLGMRDVPCILCDDLTPEQVRAFRIADNKVAEIADWDWPKLAQELDELLKEDVDLSITGFSDDEIERLTKNLDDIDISDFFSENESEAKAKNRNVFNAHTAESGLTCRNEEDR